MRTNDLIQELSSNFIEYAAAVNGDRAIPDARSGLKPVARRILYGAFEGGKLSNKPCKVHKSLVKLWVSFIHMVTLLFMALL